MESLTAHLWENEESEKKNWGFIMKSLELVDQETSSGSLDSKLNTAVQGTFLVIQWLRLCTSPAEGMGFNPWSGN